MFYNPHIQATPWVEKSPGLTFPPDLFTEGAKSGIHQAKTNASQNPAKSPGIWVDTKWVGFFLGVWDHLKLQKNAAFYQNQAFGEVLVTGYFGRTWKL